MEIVEAATGPRLAGAKALVQEYLAELGVDLGFQDVEAELERFPGDFSPPAGAVLLALDGEQATGVVALRALGASVCEMKRLFVRPAARGTGLGRALAERVIAKAVALGYRTMRLDTLPSMAPALRLYRDLGFREIPPYRYNPLPGARFLELDLSAALPDPKRAGSRPGR